MRVGGGEMGSRLRGGGGKAAVMVLRRSAGEEGERGGCSASSTSSGRGSSRGDSVSDSALRRSLVCFVCSRWSYDSALLHKSFLVSLVAKCAKFGVIRAHTQKKFGDSFRG